MKFSGGWGVARRSVTFWWWSKSPSLILPQSFTPQCIFSGIAIVYYYSPGGSTSVNGGMHSIKCSVVTGTVCYVNNYIASASGSSVVFRTSSTISCGVVELATGHRRPKSMFLSKRAGQGLLVKCCGGSPVVRLLNMELSRTASNLQGVHSKPLKGKQLNLQNDR